MAPRSAQELKKTKYAGGEQERVEPERIQHQVGPEYLLDQRYRSTTGRTSTAPPRRAAGIRAARQLAKASRICGPVAEGMATR